MAKFIELTEKSTGGPIAVNLDAVQTVKPGRNDGTHMQFMNGGDQHYVVVEEAYDDVMALLGKD